LRGSKKCIPSIGLVNIPILGYLLVKGVNDLEARDLIGYFCVIKLYANKLAEWIDTSCVAKTKGNLRSLLFSEVSSHYYFITLQTRRWFLWKTLEIVNLRYWPCHLGLHLLTLMQ
jgi:hypothetical protein